MPSQRIPYAAMATRSRRRGSGSRRTSATAPRTAQLTTSRPNASAPGESAWPAARMPTNAEPQAVTVASPAMSAAASARQALVGAPALSAGPAPAGAPALSARPAPAGAAAVSARPALAGAAAVSAGPALAGATAAPARPAAADAAASSAMPSAPRPAFQTGPAIQTGPASQLASALQILL